MLPPPSPKPAAALPGAERGGDAFICDISTWGAAGLGCSPRCQEIPEPGDLQ